MRKSIAGMKSSVDGKIEGPQGYADWVEAWPDDYDLMPQVDACLLGGVMYPGYERYWTTIQNEPDKPLPMTGKLATKAGIEWARFAAQPPGVTVKHDALGRQADKATRHSSGSIPAWSLGSRFAQEYRSLRGPSAMPPRASRLHPGGMANQT